MSVRRATFLLCLALMGCAPLAVRAQTPQCKTGTIPTSSGPVCGTMTSSSVAGEPLTASAYLGIPYAVPPVGPLRWQYSTPFEGSELLQATAYGNECPQPVPTSTGSQCPLAAGQSEDCLYLNLWVPNGTTASSQLPVMVYIHGGSFVTGSGGGITGNFYDGTWLAATGKVIVVTLNYRLGVLGFLAHGGNNNFGFADQILALEWVQKNIANFGGNPKNVTLFGESAGAMSIGLHALSSPRSSGLFQAAIMESNLLGLPYKSTSDAQALSEAFCASNSSRCTTATSACELIEAQALFPESKAGEFPTLSDLLKWAPAVDNVYVTRQPMASAGSLGVPLILGTNRDEGANFVYLAEARNSRLLNASAYETLLSNMFGSSNVDRILALERYRCATPNDCSGQLVNVITDSAFTCANRRFAIEATQGASSQPLYIYQFTHVSSFNLWSPPLPSVPQCNQLVCHADELPYVFNTAWVLGHTFNGPEELLSQTIGGYWTSFAGSYNPGSSWPLFKSGNNYRLLDTILSTKKDPLDATANCSLWDGIGYGTQQIDAIKKKASR